MEISTTRLNLRPFKMTDAEDFFRITRDYSVKKYVSYVCSETLKEMRMDIKRYYIKADFKNDFYFVIENKKTHQMIGALIATKNNQSKFDISLIIAKQFRKKGYMSEALEGFIKNMPKESVLLFIIEESNEASIRTVKKIPRIVALDSYEINGYKIKNKKCFELTV